MKKIDIITGCAQIAIFIIIMGTSVYYNGITAIVTSITNNIAGVIFYGIGVFFNFRGKDLLAAAAYIIAVLLVMHPIFLAG